MSEVVQITLAERSIKGHFFESKMGKGPGIIFIHDLMGVLDVTLKTGEILSDAGYHVLIPDLYSSDGGAKYCVRQIFESSMRNNEPGNAHLKEIDAVLEFFKRLEVVDENNIGMVGQCLTGGFILHMAIRQEVKAPVVFHHSFGLKGSGIPSACSQLIQNKIQGHFVHIDPFCPKSRVEKLQKQLGDMLESHRYALPHGVPHLFFKNEQGKKAFQRMLAFFQTQLKST